MAHVKRPEAHYFLVPCVFNFYNCYDVHRNLCSAASVETQDLQCITIIVVFDVYPWHTPLELSRSLLCFSVMVGW